MKKILVPTDFSPNADKALDVAVQIAKKVKAKIFLIHACDLLELTFKDNLAMKKEFNRKVITEANEKLSLLQKSIKDTEKVFIQSKLFEGFVTDTILYAADKYKADLIVMGTLGDAGVKERILGSKTAAIIGKASIPVLAVPLMSEWKAPGNILLGINNFKEGTDKVLKPVLELADLFQTGVHVVKFTDSDTAEAVDYLADEKGGINYIKKMQAKFKNIHFSFVHLDGAQFEKAIEKYLSSNKVDLLAMITHRRSFVKSIFSKSITRKMSYHTNVPLLTLPVQ